MPKSNLKNMRRLGGRQKFMRLHITLVHVSGAARPASNRNRRWKLPPRINQVSLGSNTKLDFDYWRFEFCHTILNYDTIFHVNQNRKDLFDFSAKHPFVLVAQKGA